MAASDGPTLFDEKEGSEVFGGTENPSALSTVVPLVQCRDGAYSVSPEAIALLETLGDEPVASVAVAGLYRTGKSFLLNRLLRTRAFETSSAVSSCTKGIILAIDRTGPHPILVLDTEGLGATDTSSDNHDARIFALALLLSSEFIYNSLGKVDETALGQLGLVLNLAEQLVDDSDPPCWNLTWIVRDFTLELIHPETKEMMTPTEYLTMALTIQGGLDAAKNKTRSTIQRLFDRRECITCPRPAHDELLGKLGDLDDSDLNPKFVAGVDAVRDRMKSAAPMKAGGRDLTGALFGSLVAQYCEAINGGRLPSVSDAWEAVVERENRAAADRVFSEFQALCERRRLDPPMALQSALLDGIEEAMTQYQHLALDRDHQPARDELRNRLGAHQTQVCTAAVSTYALRIKEEAEALSRPPAASLVELRSRFEKASAESNHPQEWQGAAFSGMWDAVERFSSKRESEHAHLSTQLAEAKLATERAQGAAVRERMEIEEEARKSIEAADLRVTEITSELEVSQRNERLAKDSSAEASAALSDETARADSALRELEEVRAMLDEARAKPNTPPPPPEIDTAALEMAEAAAAEASDKLRRAEAKMEEDAVRLLALEAEVEELNATRAERDDLKDRIRSHAEELARASAAADELERRSTEEAERTRKESEDAVSEMQALLRKERERGKRQREALVASADAAANSSAEALRQAQEETEQTRCAMERDQQKHREEIRSLQAAVSAKDSEIERYASNLREQATTAAAARREIMERHERATSQSLQRERETNATHAELVKQLTDGARESERRAATVEARLEVSERRREALETELTELQQRLTGGQQATADRAALRRELEAVRAMKDDVESRLAEARRESSDAVQARRSLEQRHRSEMSNLKVTYERQIANLEDRLEDLQQQ